MSSIAFENGTGIVLNTVNSFTIFNDLDELVNKILQRLQFFQAEWFLNTSLGVPYFQEIFSGPVDAGLIVNTLNNEISKESAVTLITDVKIDYNKQTREFAYAATIDTIYGSADINSTIEVSP